MAGASSFPPDAILRIDAQMADLLKAQAAASSSADAEAVRGSLLIGNRNAANGFAGLNADGDLVGPVTLVYENRSDFASQVLAAGQMAYSQDSGSYYLGDGTTAGGVFQWGKAFLSQRVVPNLAGPWAVVFGTPLSILEIKVDSADQVWEYFFTIQFRDASITNAIQILPIETRDDPPNLPIIRLITTFENATPGMAQQMRTLTNFTSAFLSSGTVSAVDTITGVSSGGSLFNVKFATPTQIRYAYQFVGTFTTQGTGTVDFQVSKDASVAGNIGVGWNCLMRRIR